MLYYSLLFIQHREHCLVLVLAFFLFRYTYPDVRSKWLPINTIFTIHNCKPTTTRTRKSTSQHTMNPTNGNCPLNDSCSSELNSAKRRVDIREVNMLTRSKIVTSRWQWRYNEACAGELQVERPPSSKKSRICSSQPWQTDKYIFYYNSYSILH